MGYSIFKISSLKSEEDFKRVIQAPVNEGSLTYYKCKDYLEKQDYYKTHELRKNGVIAIAIQFKLGLVDTPIS